MGKVEGEPASRGGPLAAPKGREAGRGETTLMGWEYPQRSVLGEWPGRENWASRPQREPSLGLLRGLGRGCVHPRSPSAALGSVEDAGKWAPAYLGSWAHLAPSRSI